MKKKILGVCLLCLILLIFACNLPGDQTADTEIEELTEVVEQGQPTEEIETQVEQPDEPTQTQLDEPEPPIIDQPAIRIQLADIEYLGAFRLPEGSGGSDWDYSGHGLTYYPGGDPSGDADGFPGSLFGVGHDHQEYVSEISIPIPVISTNLEDLNTAITLQPFADLSGGIFVAEEMVLPRAGIEYLAAFPGQDDDLLYFTWGQHIQYFEPSHGSAGLDLSINSAEGPYDFGEYTNYITSDYLFEIPQDWADAYAPGMRLVSGRFREGVWGGGGPVILAYDPLSVVDGEITEIMPLLLYGEQLPGQAEISIDESMQMNSYLLADHWWGGAWLTAGDKSAVVFTGTKALGESWYGFANGVVWAYDCMEQDPPTCPDYPEFPYDDRGFWADGYQAQIIFFDTNELADVARGEMETWEPQPYAILDLTDYLFEPELNYAEYKRDLIGAAAYDRENGLLYVVERLADEYKSVIHVFRIH